MGSWRQEGILGVAALLPRIAPGSHAVLSTVWRAGWIWLRRVRGFRHEGRRHADGLRRVLPAAAGVQGSASQGPGMRAHAGSICGGESAGCISIRISYPVRQREWRTILVACQPWRSTLWRARLVTGAGARGGTEQRPDDRVTLGQRGLIRWLST